MTAPLTAHDLAVTRARLEKALRIEHALRIAGCHDEQTARSLDATGRRNAERAAGVRLSSESTWAMVYILLGYPRPTPEQAAAQGRALDDLADSFDDGNGVAVSR